MRSRAAARRGIPAPGCIIAGLLLVASGACGGGGAAPVRVASTTSLYDTGLLDELVPAFHAARPEYVVHVVAVGTGEALALGRRGDADLVIVHAPEHEERFLAEGHGLRRTVFMRNDFVLAGPEDDPAGIAGAIDVEEAMRRIARAGSPFASRGDDSGTHIRERQLWDAAGLEPGGDWYIEVGQGMGATLLFAGEKRTYVLTDRSTLTTMRANGVDLHELCAGDGALENIYAVIPVAGAKEAAGAAAFEAWILGPEAETIIRGFGAEKYGRPLFEPLPLEASDPAT